MKWRQIRAHDDHGHSAEQPQREEVIWSAHDAEGCEWTVALHDDGNTWNLTHCTGGGQFIGGLVGFRSAEHAMQVADERAAAGD